jgi:hypothetical protein
MNGNIIARCLALYFALANSMVLALRRRCSLEMQLPQIGYEMAPRQESR